MTDLLDEVRASFEGVKTEQGMDYGPMTVISPSDMGDIPGFDTMRGYYEQRLLVWARRGYRYFAGATPITDGDKLLVETGMVMLPPLTANGLAAFADGVLVGHRDDHIVKMCFHFETVEHLWHDGHFREQSTAMAKGFNEDREVTEYFSDYVLHGMTQLSHLTGFAHNEVEMGKVWDLWLLVGTAVTAASYLAGFRMGNTWRERDVLDGIALASEEDADGPVGEAGQGS